MKKYKIRRSQLLSGLGAILLAFGGCMINHSSNERPPERGFVIDELLIDETSFPVGWKVTEGPSHSRGKAPMGGGPNYIQYTSIFFHKSESNTDALTIGALEEIYQFVNDKEAAQAFERQKSMWFPTGKYWSQWQKPKRLDFQSHVAAQLYYACAQHGSSPKVSSEVCGVMGQYEEYLVWFNVDIFPDEMTYSDFERALLSIDERMAEYLMTTDLYK